ncbi:MAG: head GIN domain-containing protein [Bacteroidota bacterium]
MKRIVYITALLLCVACNTENAPDCFQTEGSIVITRFDVPFFSRIRIEDDVSLVIRQGDIQEVFVETGENLLNDVSVTVENEVLVFRDSNRCNLLREYGVTQAVVTTPDLKEIRNASEFNVVGQGVLRFPNLKLTSNTEGAIEDARKNGDFTLTVQCEDLVVEANGFSTFYIDGFTERANLGFTDEIPRFEGANLMVNDLRILQRSANVMIVNPQESIRGQIRGTGDVISVNRPSVVEVEEFFTGRLIFQD